ncbi:splicing factor 3B subunit 1 (SF3B1) [Vairimorpha necatrix]|uniref:Splicing factor 3B subunit 1 (SF3B1) n=1 Tax=Vairimorpha necatrix TaxID=6039 RepID=A0AAX4JAD9_9MICR
MHLKKEKTKTSPIKDITSKIKRYEIIDINIVDFFQIFEHEDFYIQFYLLKTNKLTNYSINKKILHKIIEMVKNIKNFTLIKYNQIDLNVNIMTWLKKNIQNFTHPLDIISILQECEVNNEDIDFFRNYFGYNIIYKEYKKLIDLQSTENLSIILKLLDNNKICHNRLLDVYKQLNYYLENNLLDRNFLFCCRILYYLLDYDFKMFSDDYKDFLLGYSVYLIDLMFSQDTFKIFESSDLELLIELIKLIYQLGSSKYKKGIYLRCIEESIHLFTNIYEDTMMMIFILKILDFTDGSYDESDTLELLHDNLENFTISTQFKTFSDYDFMIENFLKYKYKILNKIKMKFNKSFDIVKIYNDLYNNDLYNEIILRFINKSTLDLLLDNLLIIINNSKNKIQFINILFRDMNLSYLYLYLITLKDNHKDVLYFVVYFINMDFRNTEKYFEMLMMIYFMFIEVEDIYLQMSRVKIINQCINLQEIDTRVIFKEMKKYGKRHKNIFILFYFLSEKLNIENKEDFLFIYQYLLEDLRNIKKTKRPNQEIIKTCTVGESTFTYKDSADYYKLRNFIYLTAINLISNFKNEEKVDMVKSQDFDNLMILIFYLKKHDISIDLIKEDIFRYVFICTKRERKKLYDIIFTDKKSIIKLKGLYRI